MKTLVLALEPTTAPVKVRAGDLPAEPDELASLAHYLHGQARKASGEQRQALFQAARDLAKQANGITQ